MSKKKGRKIMVNGKEEAPLNKVKIPPSIDWEAIVHEKLVKREELEQKEVLELVREEVPLRRRSAAKTR